MMKCCNVEKFTSAFDCEKKKRKCCVSFWVEWDTTNSRWQTQSNFSYVRCFICIVEWEFRLWLFWQLANRQEKRVRTEWISLRASMITIFFLLLLPGSREKVEFNGNIRTRERESIKVINHLSQFSLLYSLLGYGEKGWIFTNVNSFSSPSALSVSFLHERKKGNCLNIFVVKIK